MLAVSSKQSKITVFYDGACPRCVRDRKYYEMLAGERADEVCWFDITDQDARLRELGIDPKKALTELHVKADQQPAVSELDAYILLMQRVWLLKPLAWLLGLPLVRPLISRIYRRQVWQRLKREGRL